MKREKKVHSYHGRLNIMEIERWRYLWWCCAIYYRCQIPLATKKRRYSLACKVTNFYNLNIIFFKSVAFCILNKWRKKNLTHIHLSPHIPIFNWKMNKVNYKLNNKSWKCAPKNTFNMIWNHLLFRINESF